MTLITRGTICFFSDSPVLDQVARDLAQSITDPALLEAPIDVIVGVHRYRSLPLRPGRRILGIQTEHFRDAADGTPLTKKSIRKRRLARYLRQCNLLLDLAAYNRRQYGIYAWIMKSKLVLGPHVFPAVPRDHDAGSGDSLLFVGAMNARREEALSRLRQSVPVVAHGKLYGAALDEAVQNAMAMLNLHHWPGLYTEVPRLLAAYLQGKALVSEPLAPPFVAGRHYCLPDAASKSELRDVFENVSREILPNYNFDAVLRKTLGQ